MKVLYVEDNPANVFLVKRVARMGKHEIINYIDGDVALKKYDEIQPDLILMDIQLAGNKSGLDVVKKLRERGITTPIIAVTAYAMVGDKERCIAAGCDDYLPKPLPVQRLVEIFQHHSDLAATKAPDTATVEDEQETSVPAEGTVIAEASDVAQTEVVEPPETQEVEAPSKPKNTVDMEASDVAQTETVEPPETQEIEVSSTENNSVELPEETIKKSDPASESATKTEPSHDTEGISK